MEEVHEGKEIEWVERKFFGEKIWVLTSACHLPYCEGMLQTEVSKSNVSPSLGAFVLKTNKEHK